MVHSRFAVEYLEAAQVQTEYMSRKYLVISAPVLTDDLGRK